MEIKYVIDICEYQPKVGGFSVTYTRSLIVDTNTTTKELFEQIVEIEDRKNKYFVMQVIENTDTEIYNFYTIRTNKDGLVDDIQLISPNNLDKDILIDAILGCKITDGFALGYNDAVIKKCIKLKDEKFVWAEDSNLRLQKVNALRLKETYTRLKATIKSQL